MDTINSPKEFNDDSKSTSQNGAAGGEGSQTKKQSSIQNMMQSDIKEDI